ncbi:FitA-like ribbon-helix-helix domain-containing protein [Pseudoduganella aquatica]|uniref:Plasmid stabilization protein n=1 Tax=Pseudoduganella aquatica TaxID=2660641 RepID=A0A7X4H7Y3_9BURK|nr:plasmid stabilization protein [Pseudoduganella aquatica]MYN05813.1 plasmid stabilization protein [Pseudoduganella aquatica]
MNTLTIRNLDDELRARLRSNAARNKRSVENEALQILKQALGAEQISEGLGSKISRRFAQLDLPELALPVRQDKPRAANLSE